jgi:hypothetical protein
METGLLIFFATLSISFGIAYLSVSNKLKKSNLALVDTFIAKKAVEEVLLKTKGNAYFADDSIHKEDFIKFLSDSRDWAFDYIETSQKTIEEISKELKDIGLDQYSEKLSQLLPEKK